MLRPNAGERAGRDKGKEPVHDCQENKRQALASGRGGRDTATWMGSEDLTDCDRSRGAPAPLSSFPQMLFEGEGTTVA
jgi:hypothetical protein